ncbi:Protein archease [uncultured archaeon]|nr:Protein archease [uncultured archaeon]
MYSTFENKADIGVRGKGTSLNTAFSECAKAMTSIMASLKKIAPKKKIVLEVKASDTQALLVAFLNELLFIKDAKQMIFSKFEVAVEADEHGAQLKAICFGEKINSKRHELMTEVKAATYSQLKVAKKGKEWVAQCIVDV